MPNPQPHIYNAKGDVPEVPIATDSLAAHHEVDDVSLRAILQFAAALVIGSLIVIVILWWLIQIWSAEPAVPRLQVSPTNATPPAAPGPGLDARPAWALDTLVGGEDERLRGYEWQDRDAGTVRIPISRAMEIIVSEGLPANAEGTVPTFGLDPAYQLDSSGGQTREQEFATEPGLENEDEQE